MPDHVVVFDCEQLTVPGAPQRFWCGPEDPDPLLVQIGAVRLSLVAPFELQDTLDCLVQPAGRDGPVALPAFFARLTGITADRVEAEGVCLSVALDRLAAFAEGAPLYSWGKDEINAIAPSCFAAGIVSPLPAARFGNAAVLVRQAGEALDIVHGLRSHTIAAHFGVASQDRAHDGLADALSVARVLQHLLRAGRLEAAAVARPSAA